MSFLTDPKRYQGKPLLRLLECYVLHAIGELTESQQRALREITPRLRELHGGVGEWPGLVEHAAGLSSELPEKIRALWQSNLAAIPPTPRLKPQPFAERFVDITLGQRDA